MVSPIIIISGPSGAGKSSLVRRLLAECPLPLELSVSATTRPARPSEIPGRDYHFLSDEQFQSLRSRDAFLECKEVFGRGYWYGTLRETVEDSWSRSKWVILEIDVEGARSVLRQYPDAVSIFVHPGSMEELERRLRDRGTENSAAIERRLAVARVEMDARELYRHEIINDDLGQAVLAVCRLLQSYLQTDLCLKS